MLWGNSARAGKRRRGDWFRLAAIEAPEPIQIGADGEAADDNRHWSPMADNFVGIGTYSVSLVDNIEDQRRAHDEIEQDRSGDIGAGSPDQAATRLIGSREINGGRDRVCRCEKGRSDHEAGPNGIKADDYAAAEMYSSEI